MRLELVRSSGPQVARVEVLAVRGLVRGRCDGACKVDELVVVVVGGG